MRPSPRSSLFPYTTLFRSAVGLAIIGIIVAEFFTAISGLGGMIVEYANVFATAKLFVPIIVIALVGVVLTELVMWLERDRKSTRLNSSHRCISYAVFCLKK